MPATVTKLPPEPASQIAEAEAAQQEAHAEAADITTKVAELTRSGPGFDQTLHARLKVEQEAALKTLRAADLQVEEQRAAATAPIPTRVLSKIRIMRRKTHDAHAALLMRMAEATRLRAHRKGLENTVAEIQRSPEFRRDHQGVISSFVWGKNGKGPGDRRAPAADHRDSPETIKQLGKLERSLTITTTELQIAQAAQSEAQARWESAKGTLDRWQAAARAQGPAAARALLELPQAGVLDDQGIRGYADISAGENQTPVDLHESGKSAGRDAAVE